MKPALWLALAASLGLSAWVALQPDGQDEVDAASSLVVTPRRGAAPASPAMANRTPSVNNTTSARSSESTEATPTAGYTSTAATTPALPARAADWPAAPPRALLAWGAPPPPPAPPAPVRAPTPPAEPQRPRAPAFPYQWIGTLDDGHGAQALLGGNVRAAAVRVGHVLDGQWRVERIREQQLDLLWLPGEQAVTVRGGVMAAGRPARPARDTDNNNPEAEPEPAS